MKTISTIVISLLLSLSLLVAPAYAVAPASAADATEHAVCSDTDPSKPPCTPPSNCSDTDPSRPPCTIPPCVDSPDRPCPDPTLPPQAAGTGAEGTCAVAGQGVDYRVQLATATARVQQLADRRAATIKRLRAKIRKLR